VVLAGNVVCDVSTGQTTVTWTLRNLAGVPLNITGDERGVFSSTQLAANETTTVTETFDGPDEDGQVSNTVTVVFGAGQSGAAPATVTVAACAGTPAPPDIAFTFTNDPSVPTAEVGDTVEYSYCGENNSDVDLEVVRVVDDRFGILEVPDESTIVSPGETLCNTDLGLPVSYETVASDAGTTIVNNAVVTVRTVGEDPQEFQATDPAEVEILGFAAPGQSEQQPQPAQPDQPAQPEQVEQPEQAEPTTTGIPPTRMADTGPTALPFQLVIATGLTVSGWLVIVVSRRRAH
jgi:hypothetical protein